MAEQGNGISHEAPPSGPAAPPPEPGSELRERLDRLGDIVARGFDLAEAGMSLGLTLLTTVGAAAQKKILEPVMESALSSAFNMSAQAAAPPTPAATTAASAPSSTPDIPAGPAEYIIVNRLPLVRGAPFAVSFSISNDDALAEKPVSLSIEPLTGERSGVKLPLQFITVIPQQAVIAPMDFEKFSLRGALPPELPPDRYHGFVLVDGAVRIPVLLNVGGP
jgi:hypothetical protein